ncbi:hypothetical protein [Stratiformator vulcanicus]|nr:hypothetical protein [Stratiformator vulcanicus]
MSVPRHVVAKSPDEAAQAFDQLSGPLAVSLPRLLDDSTVRSPEE